MDRGPGRLQSVGSQELDMTEHNLHPRPPVVSISRFVVIVGQSFGPNVAAMTSFHDMMSAA